MGLLSSVKVWLGVGLLVAAAFAMWAVYDAGYDSGYNERDIACRESAQQARDEAQARELKLREQSEQIERERIDTSAEREVIYETIEKEVIKYVEVGGNSECVADDDFLRIWRAANAGLATVEGAGAATVDD